MIPEHTHRTRSSALSCALYEQALRAGLEPHWARDGAVLVVTVRCPLLQWGKILSLACFAAAGCRTMVAP